MLRAYEGVYTGERFERNVQEELCADAAAGLLEGHGAVDLSGLEQGQKNSAPAERGTKFALKEYSEQQKQNWSASKRIVIYSGQEQLENFVRDSISDKTMSKKMYFGAISNDLAERILADTGINVENYNLSLGSYEIRKILKDHGDGIKEDKRGQRAIVPEDFAHIMDVVLNPDKITLSDDTYMEKPAIIFTGNYNGRMNVVAVVSDKRLDLFVQTAYVNVKKGNLAMPTDERASVNTPGANNGTASFDNTIAQDKEKSQEAKLSVGASERDSAGRELSAEQAEYFKDSKVRDKDGNLLVLYHGTGMEWYSEEYFGETGEDDYPFTEFVEGAESGESGGDIVPSAGIWMTSDEETAREYASGNGVFALYARMKEPLDATTREGAERLAGVMTEYYDMWMAGVQTRTMPTQCIIKRISCVPLVHEQRSRHMPGALLIFQKGMDRL